MDNLIPCTNIDEKTTMKDDKADMMIIRVDITVYERCCARAAEAHTYADGKLVTLLADFGATDSVPRTIIDDLKTLLADGSYCADVVLGKL